MLDFKGRAKWDSWNKNKGIPSIAVLINSSEGMSKEDAQKNYISLVEKLSVNYA